MFSMANKCKECGCTCAQCMEYDRKHNDVHLHAEIENLRQRLLERDNHIVTMETHFLNEADKFPNGELASTKEEILIWQDKYARLYEAHKRIQKVNQNLEDKLLRIVDKCETEKGAFAKDIATLSHRLADANYTIHRLTQDNEKYRNDVNLAIQLLQCKPSNFISQKYDMLPPEVQAKVRTYVAQKSRSNEDTSSSQDVKSITVPISTFPPTAMVYNVTKTNTEKQQESEVGEDLKAPVNVVSASIMAKVLEEREKERIFGKHCNTCTCSKSILKVDSETQTPRDSHLDSHSVHDVERAEYVDENRRLNSQYNCRLEPQELEKSTDSTKTEVKRNSMNADVSKVSSRGNLSSTRGYIALKNSSRNLRMDDTSEVAQNWCKFDRKSSKDLRNLESSSGSSWKEQEDIINERLWKSTWTKSHFQMKDGLLGKADRTSSEISKIDAINDRVWRNNRYVFPLQINSSYFSGATRCRIEDANKSTALTMIEVKNAEELAGPCIGGSRQAEATASSSFSSDSIVISTSDPSSISSDAGKSSNNRDNDASTRSSKQDRASGPRNCLIRVKTGSKNILLDNVSTYQTVLYTSGSERPNAILVHSMKSRLERSASLSSEDNSSILSHDTNSQLQRVAEWVESSVCGEEKQHSFLNKTREKNFIGRDEFSVVLEDVKVDGDKDLITFEMSSDEDRSLYEKESRRTATDRNSEYEVKITKEMEETYLKLAASLDPITLNLSSSGGSDLTIEKYRKDHKRFHHQKSKTGSTA